MRVVWDSAKSGSNVSKHGVRFSDAATALDDPMALTICDDRHSEQRFVTVATDILGRLIVVVYTYAEEGNVRLISARKATRSERSDYEGKRR